jgi:hypothetical protein
MEIRTDRQPPARRSASRQRTPGIDPQNEIRDRIVGAARRFGAVIRMMIGIQTFWRTST